jgi:hypothetical protein
MSQNQVEIMRKFTKTKIILVIGLNSFLEMFEIVIMYKYHMIKNISIAYFCSMSQVSIESSTMVPCTSMVLEELIMKSSQVWHYNPRCIFNSRDCVGQC